MGISFEEAEALKIQPAEQQRLYPVVHAVMEKVGSITSRHIHNHAVDNITMVGGTTAFKGMAEVVQEYTGIKTSVPKRPLFITPLGMAMFDSNGSG